MELLKISDYNEFAFVIENRDVNERKVKQLADSIDELNYLICPIIVTEKMSGQGLLDIEDKELHANEKRYVVVDGQHRLEACKFLDRPVDVVVNPNVTRDDIVTANNTGSKWNKENFISFYKEKGNHDYALLETFVKQNREQGFSITVTIEAFKKSGKVNDGTYTIDYVKGAKIIGDALILKSVFSNPKAYKEAKMVRALKAIYNRYPNMNAAVLAEQIIKANRQDLALIDIPSEDSQTLLGIYGNSFETVEGRDIPHDIREFVLAYYNGRCNYTGCSGEANHVDHINAFANGGKTEIDNLQLLCEDCNKRKSAKL